MEETKEDGVTWLIGDTAEVWLAPDIDTLPTY